MTNWYRGHQVWLNENQMMNNAQIIINYYIAKGGWSKESLSAMIGNMTKESSVNPNMYEYGYSWAADRGYGLVQWTPRSKFWNWAISKGLDPELPESQLARIDWEVEHNTQWINTRASSYYGYPQKYNMTFKEFRENAKNLSVADLAIAFALGYEAPAISAFNASKAGRISYAEKIYNTLDFTGLNEPPDVNNDDINPHDTPNGEGIENQTNFADEVNGIISNIETLLNVDIYDTGSKNFYTNKIITIQKQLDNTFKVRPSEKFFNDVRNYIDDLFSSTNITPDTSNPNTTTTGGKPKNPTDPDKTKLAKKYGTGKPKFGVVFVSKDNQPFNVFATQEGKIIEIGNSEDEGNFIIIKHSGDNYLSKYTHLDNISLNENDDIKKGEKIATSKNNAIGFIISETENFDSQEKTINPLDYLNQNFHEQNPSNVQKVLDKAFSFPDNSIPYSMQGPRDNVTSGDCSSYVRACYLPLGIDIGGYTGAQYQTALAKGWTVHDGNRNKLPAIIRDAKAGDFLLLSTTSNFGAGGASHVMLITGKNKARHQSPPSGPDNAVLDQYINYLPASYFRWCLCRPI